MARRIRNSDKIEGLETEEQRIHKRDMHEFIEAAGGIEENEVMLANNNTAESKSLRTEQKGEWCHRPWEKQRGREGNWNGKWF